MRVLLTRPNESGEETARLLRARGHEVLLSPVTEIRLLQGPDLQLDGVQAILVTSGNGLRALASRTKRRDIPVFAVGARTGELARAARFSNVRHSDGDSSALAEAVARWASAEAGPLLHAAGRNHSALASRVLTTGGFTVRTEELYEAIEIPKLSAKACNSIAAGTLDAVMLFSPRSTEIFARQVRRAGLAKECADLIALCISAITAQGLAPLLFSDCRIAEHPEQESMLALVDKLAEEAAADHA